MASEPKAKDAFIAAVEAKISAWTAVLSSYRAAVALDGPLGEGAVVSGVGSASGVAVAHGYSHDLPVGVFRDKSIKEAIEIYLGAGRRKQTNKEIAIGLQKGGIATTSTNFEATIATALYRMKEEGTVLRFSDGWDLAGSYPDSLRSRLEKDTKPTKRPRRTKKSKAPRRTKTTKVTEPASAGPDDKTALMLDFISSGAKSIAEIVTRFKSAGIECSRDYVRVVTKRLRARGKIEIRDGMFFPKAA